MIVVAIGHRKSTGKDTFAKFLSSHLKMNTRGKIIKVVGFADKLKDVCHQLFGWAGLKPGLYYEQENTYHERNLPLPVAIDGVFKTPRDIWIEFGQHCRKYYGKIWLDGVLKNTTCDVLIIKDLRFPTEVEGVQEVHGQLVKVENPNIPDTDDEADCALVNFDGWHYIFNNLGSKEDLAKKAQLFGDYLLEKLNAR